MLDAGAADQTRPVSPPGEADEYLGRPKIPKHVRGQVARRIRPAGKADDPRAGITVRRAAGFPQPPSAGTSSARTWSASSSATVTVSGTASRAGSKISCRAAGDRSAHVASSRGGGASGRFDLPPPGVGRDPLDAVLDLACPGLPLRKIDAAQRGQAAVQFVALVPQVLHFLGQPGRVATLSFGSRLRASCSSQACRGGSSS